MSYHSLFYSYKEKSPWTADNKPNIINPMIVAMTEMGLSGSQIRSLANKFLEQNSVSDLEKAGVLADTIQKENWKDFLGQKNYYLEYCRFFEERITTEPENIRDYFVEIADGIYSNDFFSLIRLAYAFESGQKEELAAAFAFFAAGYEKIEFVLPEKETKVFMEDLVALNEKKDKYQITGSTLTEQIKNIAANSPYLDDFAKLEEENLNIFTLRALAIRLSREIPHPVTKYLLCAVHSLRVISPLLPDLEKSIAQFYMVMQATYLALGCPQLQEVAEGKEKTWQLIFQLTAVSNDISNILFVYSCFREYQFANSSIYSEMAYHVIHNEIKPLR